MEFDYKVIGQRIKSKRTTLALTQHQIAETTGLSKTHISNIETAKSKVSLPTLVKIADALESSLDELTCDNIKSSRHIFENELKRVIEDCDDLEIRVISDIVKAIKTSIRNRIINNRDIFKSLSDMGNRD